MDENTQLDKYFQDIREYLDNMDKTREKVLSIQRLSIRKCGEIIKKVHRGEIIDLDKLIDSAKSSFMEMENLISEAPGVYSKDYRGIAAQELGEAIIFYNLVVNSRFPEPTECSIGKLDYAYALSDVVGELRRYVLKSIRNENLDISFRLFDYMNEIFAQLFTLDYPNGLMPGLRRKIDVARGIIAKTEGDLTLSSNLIKLKHTLQEEKKQ